MMKQGKLGFFASLLAAACGARGAPAPDQELTLRPWFRDLRTVTVHAGADSLSLLLDTGGGATLITPAVAARLGCRPHGSDIGHRMTGEVVEFAHCDSLRLSAGGWSATLAPVAVYGVNALLPPELPRLDGVLALDAFDGRVVTLDWGGSRIVLHGAGSADSAAGSGLDFRRATGTTGRFLEVFIRVEGTRGPLWFLLDTGNLRGTLVARSLLRDSLLPLRDSVTATLRIGGRPATPFGFTAAPLQVDGALGTDFVLRGPVTLDLRRR